MNPMGEIAGIYLLMIRLYGGDGFKLGDWDTVFSIEDLTATLDQRGGE